MSRSSFVRSTRWWRLAFLTSVLVVDSRVSFRFFSGNWVVSVNGVLCGSLSGLDVVVVICFVADHLFHLHVFTHVRTARASGTMIDVSIHR